MQNDTPMTVTHIPIEVEPIERLHAPQLEDPVNSLTNLNNQGVDHLKKSEYREAIDNFQRALQMLGQKYDPLKFASLAGCENDTCADGRILSVKSITLKRQNDKAIYSARP